MADVANARTMPMDMMENADNVAFSPCKGGRTSEGGRLYLEILKGLLMLIIA